MKQATGRVVGFVAVALLAVSGFAGRALAQGAGWAEKMFEERSYDFGVVARGSTVSHRFKVTNIYDVPVHIASVRTTCGCTAASPSKTTLEPGESAYIEASMDTVRFVHRKDSNLIITFDAPYYAEVYIPLTVYIRRDVVFTPGSANFGVVPQGKQVEKKIDVAYAGRPDWKIVEVKSGSPHVEARVVETRRTEMYVNYDLFVTLKGTAPPGDFRTLVTLITDDQTGREVPLLVEAQIESEYSVTPSVLSLGLLRPGEQRLTNVVIKGRHPFQIEKIECDSGSAVYKVRLPKEAKTIHVVPFTVIAPTEPGTIDETFTVHLKAGDKTAVVTFKAYGRVAAPGP